MLLYMPSGKHEVPITFFIPLSMKRGVRKLATNLGTTDKAVLNAAVRTHLLESGHADVVKLVPRAEAADR